MFANSIIIKTNPFDVYNHIQTQFISIKNLNAFTSYTVIPANDLTTISNVVMDCVERLGDVSALYIKKINDSNISVITIDQLQKMHQTHNELIATIKKFNLISSDITNNTKYIIQNNFNQDSIIINYIYWDIINRYKLLIFEIIDSIKKINVYVELVKDNLNLKKF
jgi:hypothetical protein